VEQRVPSKDRSAETGRDARKVDTQGERGQRQDKKRGPSHRVRKRLTTKIACEIQNEGVDKAGPGGRKRIIGTGAAAGLDGESCINLWISKKKKDKADAKKKSGRTRVTEGPGSQDWAGDNQNRY